MSERDYFLAFSACHGIGPVKFQLLLSTFGTTKKAWEASLSDLQHTVGKKTGADVDAFRKTFSIEEYLEKLARNKVSFVTTAEKNYPKLLKQIPNPPFVLFVRGDEKCLKNDSTIGVVGARKTTGYGREVTELITSELVASGFAIVSGLAMGVDAIAHKTTLDNNGKTIAVLGCGVDCCTPGENTSLYDQIIDSGGVIVSELPLGHGPTVGTFPARNRIIAGLSQGVVVTEGAEDSGSLITAEFALKFNRKVFAVPGPITSSMSKGPYKLIAKGARLVTSGNDIIDELGIMNHELGKRKVKSEKRKLRGETKEETIILELLANEAMSFDELVRKSKLDSSQVGTLLSMMEIKGMIKSGESGLFLVSS